MKNKLRDVGDLKRVYSFRFDSVLNSIQPVFGDLIANLPYGNGNS